jgi:excinuclease UvrABC nuclease subunit
MTCGDNSVCYKLSAISHIYNITTQDISHLQGEATVASRVVFIDGRPVPSLYRKFNIKSVIGINDFASIEEVLERRFRRIPNTHDDQSDAWAMPDLVRRIFTFILLYLDASNVEFTSLL